jgi:hypothetical protein
VILRKVYGQELYAISLSRLLVRLSKLAGGDAAILLLAANLCYISLLHFPAANLRYSATDSPQKFRGTETISSSFETIASSVHQVRLLRFAAIFAIWRLMLGFQI